MKLNVAVEEEQWGRLSDLHALLLVLRNKQILKNEYPDLYTRVRVHGIFVLFN